MKTRSFPCFLLVLVALLSSDLSAQTAGGTHCDRSPEAVVRDEESLRETIREAILALLDDSGGGAAASGRAGAGPATFAFADVRSKAAGSAANSYEETLEELTSQVEIEYVGPGDISPLPAPDDLPIPIPSDDEFGEPDPEPISEWLGFNPVTCNQFRMRIPTDVAAVIADMAVEDGLDRANQSPSTLGEVLPWTWHPPEEENFGPPNTGPYFSGCTDTRFRRKTTTWPTSAIASFDGQQNTCTGTMVGPRHVITAGHCVYGGGNNWYDFTVIPGRDGAMRPFGSTLMSDTDGSSPGFRWYWIPAGAQGNHPVWSTGLDIAFLIIPERLGEQSGWMGVGAQNETELSAGHTQNRGYPGGSGGPIGFHPVQVEGALYGDINACNLGDYSHYDPNGWARVAGHACDTSSGHSGGPIYGWVYDSQLQDTAPAVLAIISHHAFGANEFDCPNNPRPYKATRITPEYMNQYLALRSWKN